MERYPLTSDPSLRACSAADELLLEWARSQPNLSGYTVVAHDRFGVVALNAPPPVKFLATFHSQEEALRRNAAGRSLELVSLFDPLSEVARALVRVPKSVDLFDVYLARIAAGATPGLTVAAGFLTRHFTSRLLEVAQQYAKEVVQSRARKKARLLLLSEFRGGLFLFGRMRSITAEYAIANIPEYFLRITLTTLPSFYYLSGRRLLAGCPL